MRCETKYVAAEMITGFYMNVTDDENNQRLKPLSQFYYHQQKHHTDNKQIKYKTQGPNSQIFI